METTRPESVRQDLALLPAYGDWRSAAARRRGRRRRQETAVVALGGSAARCARAGCAASRNLSRRHVREATRRRRRELSWPARSTWPRLPTS
ncbi:MAG: hypothetical protein R3F05_08200 [Planctomycetota bacterium]